jgi:hypothetical protein
MERGHHPAGGPTVKALADALAISVSQLRVSATVPESTANFATQVC